MAYIAAALELFFGCPHSNLSRVFTIRKRSYQVCCDCGAEFRYLLDAMQIQRRESSPSAVCVPHLRSAH